MPAYPWWRVERRGVDFDGQQAICPRGSGLTLEGQATMRGGTWTAADARVATKLAPANRPATEKVAPECGTGPTLALKRKLWTCPVIRSVSRQHARDLGAVAPGAEVSRSPGGRVTQTFGATPGRAWSRRR